ncbi:calcium-dependent protein kinase 5 [Plakobranchus ocellatus]|uniref:Calcium-dependent protein kinase 5 n=1 Tax=Plakobranchus ocellatus TaxID=259542 RepID=A0AAV4BQ55_9GAST|nr:calcium-dependent protein kinase 5 [Plakobranchus ocellatus]
MKKKGGSKKKGKKSAKGKKSTKDAEDKVEGLESADPSTLISGDPAAAGSKKGKKKGKKKKLSKSEKATEKLEKQIEKLKADTAYYDGFIKRMHQWLLDNADTAVEMFRQIDSDGEGLLSFDEFKAGMFDLNAPVTKVELHLLCKLLDDEDSGEIDYTELEKGLQTVRQSRELDRQIARNERQLLLTERKFVPCPCCKMSKVEPWMEPTPRYILLELRLVTFDMYKDYPGHLELLVHSHVPVCGIIQMIVAETDISSSKLAIFRDRSRSPESVLSPDMTLEECGFPGDNCYSPEEVVLFYDYTVEFTDCPILMCDHYFGQKVL